MYLIAVISVGNKTKRTFHCTETEVIFTVVNIGIGIEVFRQIPNTGHWNFWRESPISSILYCKHWTIKSHCV